MKLSVSISQQDLEALDGYASAHGLPSRSAAVQEAIRHLRQGDLADDYAVAFAEWDASEDARLWDAVVADGVGDAPR